MPSIGLLMMVGSHTCFSWSRMGTKEHRLGLCGEWKENRLLSRKIEQVFPDGSEFTVFRERHPIVLEALDAITQNVYRLIELIEKQPSSEVNEPLYLLTAASLTEFEEVMVLAVNGYGSGSTKLLRALYERTVTTQYLMLHPKKVSQFIAYTDVHWHKLLQEAYASGIGKDLSKERREEIETTFKEVEASFTESVCKPCGRTRLQGSWTKKPLPTQAHEVNEEVGTLCYVSYLLPTFFLHTTFWGISQQLKQHPNGKRELHNRALEWHYAEHSIVYAATLMAHLAARADEFFSLNATEVCRSIDDAVRSLTGDLLGQEAVMPATSQ